VVGSHTQRGWNSSPDSADTLEVSCDHVRDVAAEICHRAGIPDDNAAIQIDVLLEAEMRGRASHGLMRLPRIVERIRNGVINPVTSGRHRWDGAFLDVDGERGLGPVVANAAMKALAVMSCDTSIAIATIHNNNHLGMLAWYAERIAEQGQVLISMTTSEALVHAWGGRSAILGTNPIAIGIPTADRPFVLDMATSLVAMGLVHDYANRGCHLQSGWALDKYGNPTTDANAAKQGSLAPFGEAKGYALGLAIELLVTALTGCEIGRDVRGTLDSDAVCNKGDVFIVVNLKRNGRIADRVAKYLDDVRRSGVDRKVLVPGDRASIARAQSIAQGIRMPTALWDRLNQLAT
jgi:LDH2 family malate/lactate/ureidoglycolate dehydrogenase